MEIFSALLAICAGNSPVTAEFPPQWPVTQSFLWSASWINGWVNNREAGDLRRHHAHYDFIVMIMSYRLLLQCLVSTKIIPYQQCVIPRDTTGLFARNMPGINIIDIRVETTTLLPITDERCSQWIYCVLWIDNGLPESTKLQICYRSTCAYKHAISPFNNHMRLRSLIGINSLNSLKLCNNGKLIWKKKHPYIRRD